MFCSEIIGLNWRKRLKTGRHSFHIRDWNHPELMLQSFAGEKEAQVFRVKVNLITSPRLHVTNHQTASFLLFFSRYEPYKPKPSKPTLSAVPVVEGEPIVIMAAKTLVATYVLFLGLCVITRGKPMDITHAYCKIVW